MKITFIDPPVLIGSKPPERVFGCTYGLYPIPNIFLLQVAAVLRRENHTVLYRNFPLEKAGRTEFIDFLKQDDSQAYCFYSVNLATAIDRAALKLIREIKTELPVIFFGPAPTYAPEQYLIDENCIVVRGEPEITFSELIKTIGRGEIANVAGVSFLKDASILHTATRQINKNLDSLPFPARDLLETNKYFNPKFGNEKFTAIATSRGCPYNCVFCVPSSLSFAREIEHKKNYDHKPPYVSRSARNVIDEFIQLWQEGYRAVSVLDDEFTIDKKRVIDICEGIQHLKIKWGCLARADSLDETVVKALSAAGCSYIDIGVESFNQAILSDIGKNLKIDTVEAALRLTKQYGIFTKINILFGSSPLETTATIEESMRRIKQLRPDAVMFSLCNPFPGTRFYQLAKEKDWFVKGDYYPVDVQKESTICLPNISKRELEMAIRKANMSFFLNPRFAIKNIRSIRSLRDLTNKFSVLLKKLF